jgi:glyoxylase-like metal-dependent hydrolase (beta-lactamase superfamily II)
VTVHLNGEDIRALHFPSGHTDGDSIIFFPKNNVVHMADDFVRYGFPHIDVSRSPDWTRWVMTLCAVLGLIFSSRLRVRTEGKASPGRNCPAIMAFLAAYTTCS